MTASFSLKNWVVVSAMTALRLPQVLPPSLEAAAATALLLLVLLNEIDAA